MNDNDRIITVDGIELYIRNPNLRIREKAESVRVKAWNKAFTDGALLAKEMNKRLQERGAFDETIKAETEVLTKELQDKLNILRKGGCKLSEARQAAIDANDLRNKILSKNAENISCANMTVEAISSNAEFNYLVSQCVVYNSDRNKTYFESYEDYLNRRDDSDAIQAATKVSEIQYGVGDISLTEEKEFLLKYKFVDEDFNFIDENGNKINRDGQLIDEEGRPYKLVRKKKVYLDEEEKVEFTPFTDNKGNPIEE